MTTTMQPEQQRILDEIRSGHWLVEHPQVIRPNEAEFERALRLKDAAQAQADLALDWIDGMTSNDPAVVLDIINGFETLRTRGRNIRVELCIAAVKLLLVRARELDTPVKMYLDFAQRAAPVVPFQTAFVFFGAARRAARSVDEFGQCYDAWRAYPQRLDRADGQKYCLMQAEKVAKTGQDWLSLGEYWSGLWPHLESTAPIIKCLRMAEKLAATPSDLLDCGTTAFMTLPLQDATRERKRLFRKAVDSASCGKDWGCLAGAFTEDGDCGRGVMPGWQARFNQIRGVPYPTSNKSDLALLGDARRAEEAAATTIDHLRAMSIYMYGVKSGRAAHFERVMGKAEATANSALDCASCALARYEAGWATLLARMQRAKRAIKKGIALAQEPADWESLAAAAFLIAEHMLRTEGGVAA